MLEILSAGILTTIQDLGRPGQGRFGVAPGGALDRAALILGNRLLSNEPGAAAIEITVIGPTLRFQQDAVIALTGAELCARLNDAGLPLWQPVLARAGDTLAFSPLAQPAGSRCYLCVAGGIAIEPVLGARATDLIGKFGGVEGRPLRAGDLVPIGEPRLPIGQVLRRRLTETPPIGRGDEPFRVMPGPQWDRFTAAGRLTFLNSAYAVSPRSNRQGLRLAGPAIEHERGADLVSEGITHGAIQVPGDGQPIVLLAARQTVGGYVKIATVIGADLDRLGQVGPGGAIRFAETTVEAAREAMCARRTWLDGIEVVEDDAPVAIALPKATPVDLKELESVAGGWDPDGVVRVLEALERTGATSLSIEVESAGIKLDVRRDGSEPVIRTTETTAAPASTPGITVVTAPVLGVFYRRQRPDEPLFVIEGSKVAKGATLGLIEVMKTYHEVLAPRDGMVTRFHVEEGQYVEYGQPIADLV